MPAAEYHGVIMATALINDQIIHYELAGAEDSSLRTPALLLHGNGESLEIFRPLVSSLRMARSFVLMDSRYQGESVPQDESQPPRITYKLMASDALKLMEHELGVKEYDIIGFSDGGITALIMAMHSVRVRRLILIGVNTDPSGLKPKAVRWIQRQKRIADKQGEAVKSELCRMMLEEPHITRDMLASVVCETTVIQGKNDEFVKKEHASAIADAIPRGSFHLIAGAGHEIPSTHTGELSDLIRTLL